MTDSGISPVPREARPYQGETAGLVTRFVANTVDALAVGVGLVVGYLGFNGFRFLVNPRGFQFTGSSVILSVTAALVVFVVYLTAAWATTGRTYGDHLMGLRVVDRRGQRVRPATALLRAVTCIVFPIGLLWCAGSRSRRSLQDMLLRTSVIYDWRPRAGTEHSELPVDVPKS